MLKPALQLKLGQQLTMTPQLQQAIRLLQLPVLELQAQVQEALESNVMLEAEEEEPIDLASLDQPAPQGEDDEDAVPEPEQVTVEMDDPWTEASTPSGEGRAPDDDDRPMEFADERERDLHQHLVWQLEVSPLDPTGVGARTAAECICLQLAQLEPATTGRELAMSIARDHLQAVADRNMTDLRRSYDADDDTLLGALALIRACNPRPGSAFEGAQPEYIVPDVFVRRTDQGWSVEINPASVPRLKVNQGYASLVARSGDYATLRAQLQEARWLIRSLEIRNDTLLKVARTIVQRQSAFLEKGDEAMQPMILRDVAAAVNMHESTISRVTTGKYMHTPRGIFEFRHFFSSHVSGADGEDVSSVAIRARIRKLIADEQPGKPLSDAQLADVLSREGVKVARRTVAKYREALGLASSSERRHAVARARA